MVTDNTTSNGSGVAADGTARGDVGNGVHPVESGPASFTVKAGLAQMLKGGVIMDVVNAEQV